MPKSPSLAGRAMLALLLMVLFYALALGMAGLLVYLPYAEWTYAHRVHPKLAFFCLLGAGIIVWSIVPRREEFEPPGPRLMPHEHPALFEEIGNVARSTGQAPPAEVYLMNDFNAGVMQRDSYMGLGGRRVMLVGLPLMQALTVSEFRSVIAHEFGHYYGGDTALGPLVYRTREAIERTATGLAQHSTLLMKPFEWYYMGYLRASHAVSRRQEYTADALAVRTAGIAPFVSGMRKMEGVAPAFQPYWREEFVPVLSAGYRPPLVDGFARFLQAPQIATFLAQWSEKQLAEESQSPYDTHPPTRERIAAAQRIPTTGFIVSDDRQALCLLNNLPTLEEGLLRAIAGGEAVGKLEPVAWEEVSDRVFVPTWEESARQYAEHLAGMTPERIPHLLGDSMFLESVRRTHGGDIPLDEAPRLAVAVLSWALIVALYRRGWALNTDPGEPVTLRSGDHTIAPFDALQALLSGEFSAEHWSARCAEWGITGVDLAPAPATEAATT